MKAKLLAEFRAMQLAVLGSASNKNASVFSLEGVDSIELGDGLEIKEVYLTMDYVIVYMGDMSSCVHISALSDDIIEEVNTAMCNKALEMANKMVVANSDGVILNWSK